MNAPTNPPRYDGTASLPKSAGACDPRSSWRRHTRDAEIASREYTRRIRKLLIDIRREELTLLERLLEENGWE